MGLRCKYLWKRIFGRERNCHKIPTPYKKANKLVLLLLSLLLRHLQHKASSSIPNMHEYKHMICPRMAIHYIHRGQTEAENSSFQSLVFSPYERSSNNNTLHLTQQHYSFHI